MGASRKGHTRREDRHIPPFFDSTDRSTAPPCCWLWLEAGHPHPHPHKTKRVRTATTSPVTNSPTGSAPSSPSGAACKATRPESSYICVCLWLYGMVYGHDGRPEHCASDCADESMAPPTTTTQACKPVASQYYSNTHTHTCTQIADYGPPVRACPRPKSNSPRPPRVGGGLLVLWCCGVLCTSDENPDENSFWVRGWMDGGGHTGINTHKPRTHTGVIAVLYL